MEKTQINKIRNKRGENNKYQGNLGNTLKAYKFENLEEMDKFLATYDHPKWNQEDINHLNRFINMQ
jgi:hypothetical protein